MTDKIAVMLCGQGSRDAAATEEFNLLASELRHRLTDYDIESGFLEAAAPRVREGLDTLAERNAERIVCIPGVLFPSQQITKDLIAEVDKFSRAHAGLEVTLGRELSMDPRVLAVARDRIEQVELEARNHCTREETLLMVVGPGSDDSKVNSDVAKVSRLLWEGMGFGWAEVSYLGSASPSMELGLAKSVKLGFKRIIVFPCFLFSGEGVRRSHAAADDCAGAFPSVEVLKAGHLFHTGLLADSLTDRIEELLNGISNMNCQVCNYREQIISTAHDHHHHHHHHHDHVHGHGHRHRHHNHGHGGGKADNS